MKTILPILLLVGTTAYGQSGIPEKIEEIAKPKMEATDFNSTRSNRERGNSLIKSGSEQSKKAPASSPAAPAPSPSVPAENTTPSSDYETSYEFHTTAKYKLETFGTNSQSNDLTYLFGDYGVQITMGSLSGASIFDTKNNTMIVLNNKSQSASVLSLEKLEASMGQTSAKSENSNTITKTGKQKVILGYNCEEYLIEGSQKTEIWITEEAGINIIEQFEKASKSMMSQLPKETAKQGGVLMEMISYDHTGKVESQLTITELKKENSTLNMAAYKVTKL